MKKNILTFIAAFCCFVSYAQAFAYHDQIDLQGKWQFALDTDAKLSVSSTFNDFVTLPGTTDTNRKGTPCTKKDETTHLSRLFSYAGRAWYRRTVDIPKTWKKKVIRLHLERTKPTTVFIDGKLVGTSNDISTAQTYDLSQVIKPGKHEITIMVDNGSGVPKQLYANSHAYTEDTQTNWNGIIDTMTGGGPSGSTTTLVFKVYHDGKGGGDLGGSAAQSVILMVIVIALTAVQFRYVDRKVTY